MSTLAPDLPQHLQALEAANRIRSDRVDLKRAVLDGHVTAGAIVLDPPECALSMTIGELLRAQHRWDVSRATGFLATVAIRETKPLGMLTLRQRAVVAGQLRPTAPRRTRPASRHPVPERALAQRLDALEHANRVRTCRALLKKDLRAGRRSIDSLLTNPPDAILTMKLFDLLLATPKYGRTKATKVMAQCRIAPSKTIAGLSERQRAEVVSLLRQRDVESWERKPALVLTATPPRAAAERKAA